MTPNSLRSLDDMFADLRAEVLRRGRDGWQRTTILDLLERARMVPAVPADRTSREAPTPRVDTFAVTGRFRVYFNRHQAAPLVWCIALLGKEDGVEVPRFEIAVHEVVFDGVRVATVYAPKATPDDEDGKPSAWMECTGTVTLHSDGRAEVTG